MWSKNCKPCSDSTLSSTPSIDSKECKARAVSKNCKPWSDSTLGSTFSIDSREHEARALIKNCKPWSDSTLSSTSSIDSREYKARALGNDEAVREQVIITIPIDFLHNNRYVMFEYRLFINIDFQK